MNKETIIKDLLIIAFAVLLLVMTATKAFYYYKEPQWYCVNGSKIKTCFLDKSEAESYSRGEFHVRWDPYVKRSDIHIQWEQ